MVHDRLRVVPPHHAPGPLLHRLGRLPRFVDVGVGHLLESRHPSADVGSPLVVLLREGHGGVAAEVLIEVGGAGEPHPVGRVQGGVGVHEEAVEDVAPLLPRDPQVAAREEAGDGMAREVVEPALRPELVHAGVDPGEARGAGLPGSQALVGLGAFGPGNLPADGVALHLVEVGHREGVEVEELAPQELPVQAHGGEGVLRARRVDVVLQAPVEGARGDAAEAQVRGERRRAALGKARALHLRGVGLGLFKVGRPDCPPAAPQRGLQALEARRLPALEREGPEGVRGRPVAEVLQGGHAPGFRAV